MGDANMLERYPLVEDTSVFERFVTLAKRELAADDVRLLTVAEAPPEAANVLCSRLPDGRHVVASFAEAPKDRDALERRLTMLANTFADALAAPGSERVRARPPVARTLHEELRALAFRAGAADVVVIDVDSPVMWGSASHPAQPRPRRDLVLRDVSRRELSTDEDELVVEESGQDVASALGRDDAEESAKEARADEEEPAVTRRALAALRALPTLGQLHKGRHLRHASHEGECWLALSFSGIYVLLLVFEAPFDELRAERAANDALPRIERLVEALPPLDTDPQPSGSVAALRRPRRR